MNLKHLRYFWVTAHHGSVAAAGNSLHLTPQTVSAQIKLLERELGVELFRPAGRGLELTEAGRVALSYADEIFALGQDMVAALGSSDLSQRAAPVIRVGIPDAVAKSLTYRLLAPLRRLPEPARLVCREGSMDSLLGELALQRLDMVLADRPMPSGLAVRAHSRKLGDSPIGFYAKHDILPAGVTFPGCLAGMPLLLPGRSMAVRSEIDRWLGDVRISPRIGGEFDDSALMKVFGQAGEGCFPAPAIMSAEICERYGVIEVGRVDEICETYWLISTNHYLQRPAIRAVIDAAGASFRSRPVVG